MRTVTCPACGARWTTFATTADQDDCFHCEATAASAAGYVRPTYHKTTPRAADPDPAVPAGHLF